MRCGPRGKVAYSRDEALRAVRAIRANEDEPEDSSAKLQAYKCADCGRWHVGHGQRVK